MQITNVVCPTSKYSIKCPDVTTKNCIVVHNTYNDASAMSEVSYMIGRPDKVSFHVAVDDYRVVTGLSFDRSCYAAGDGRYGNGNAHGINIEICYSKSGGERFEKAENLAAQYIAYLLKQYGWGIDRVKKHQDFSGKYCPHRTLDLGWQRFLNKVASYLGTTTTTSQPQGVTDRAGSYITNTRLNVRGGANTTSKIITTLEVGSMQCVDYNNGDWGHLSNGAGWINLNYCNLMKLDRIGSYEITASALNVRKYPSTSAPKTGKINKGSKQGIDYNVGNWGHLINNVGWICLDYCKQI